MGGAKLSRQTLSNWMIGAAKELDVVYQLMKRELLKKSYIQVDATTLQVIAEKGMDAKGKKYMWLYKTGGHKDPIKL